MGTVEPVEPDLQTYKRCFLGSDAVKWLMENSERISTAEEAENLGNLLIGEPAGIRCQEAGLGVTRSRGTK